APLFFRLEEGLQAGAHRPLPVGPRHMGDLAVQTRISQEAKKFSGMVQRMLLREPGTLLTIFHCSLIFPGSLHYSSSPVCSTQERVLSVPVPSASVSFPSW